MLLPPASVIATWPTPNYVNPQSRGPGLFIANTTLLVVVLIVLALRYYTRIRLTKTFGPDDILIGAALLPAIGLASTTINDFAHSTYNRHIWDVVPSPISAGIKIEVAGEVLYCTASILTKLSLSCFYLHLIKNTGRRLYKHVIYASMALFVAEWIGFTMTVFTQCTPLRAYWDVEPTYPYHCVDIGVWALTCGVLNIITDFLCLFLPVPMIWNMQCHQRTRLAILGMFGLGFLTCAAGIGRTIYTDLTLRRSYDLTWYLYPEHLATGLEIDIGLICASLPALRALYLHYFRQEVQTSQNEKVNFSWLRAIPRETNRAGPDDVEAKSGLRWKSKDSTEEVLDTLTPWSSHGNLPASVHQRSF